MDGKVLISSKTFWFNVLAALVIIANSMGFAGFTPDPQVAEYAGIAAALINIIIRTVFTDQPVVAMFSKKSNL